MADTPPAPATPLKPTGWWFYVAAAVVWIAALGVIPGFTVAMHGDVGAARLWAFAGTLLATFFVFIGVGLDVAQDWLGVLASARNTYSLSRLQMTLWTWLILSALMALTACRAWGLGAGSLSTALSIQIDGNLFAAMGISFFTGAAAPALLSLKAQGPTDPAQQAAVTARMQEPMFVQGQAIARPPDASPKLGDMVQGDDANSAGVVDLSKVQQLLVTLLLVGAYGAVLWGFFSDGPLLNVLDAQKHPTGATALPKFSEDFVKLLLLSHGGYLAYKAAPKPTPATGVSPASVAAGPPATPDRQAGIG